MSITANWSYPTAIRFGAGRISEIADACATAGIKKPLLITDRGLADMDITRKTLDLLEAAGLGRAIFADVDPNPNEKNAAAGVQVFSCGAVAPFVGF
jgi:alcohol dehydrogenase class IV